jgi:hypothetical protein
MLILLSLLAWGFLFHYAHKHPIRGVRFAMRGGGGEPEVEIPKYKKPAASSFDLFGLTGSYNKGTNTYGVSADPEELATMQAVKGIRNSLLKSLGLGGTPESDPYTNQYMQELLRTSQAPLENALIGRGLGGSTVYKDALTDLMTKASTQSVLGGQQYKMNNLQALMSYLNQNMGYGQNLLNMVQGNDIQQQQLAQQMYNTQLPYKATVSGPNTWQSIGSFASPIYHDYLSSQGYNAPGLSTADALKILAAFQ